MRYCFSNRRRLIRAILPHLVLASGFQKPVVHAEKLSNHHRLIHAILPHLVPALGFQKPVVHTEKLSNRSRVIHAILPHLVLASGFQRPVVHAEKLNGLEYPSGWAKTWHDDKENWHLKRQRHCNQTHAGQ